jgi:UDP-N-acetylglucosamine 3-dehydrogenase
MGKRRAEAVAQNLRSELLCVVDNNVMQAKSLAKELHCEFCNSFDEAIKKCDINAVVVALPNKYHTEVSIRAMKQGKHVFCEKPMAITSEEAKVMVKTSLEEGVFLKAGSNVRFFTNIVKAKEIIDSGTLGKILFARGWIGHQGWNLQAGSWFTDPELIGGGTMLDNGCHLVDIIRWFIGEIKECFGYRVTLLHKLPDVLEDNALGILIGLNGEPALIQSSWTEWNGYLYLEFYGGNSTLCIDNRGNEAKTIVKTKNNNVQVFDYSKEPKSSFQKEIDDFISSVIARKQPLPSGYDGMRTVQIINGLYQSAQQGRKVSVYGAQEQILEEKWMEKFG